MFLCTFFLSGLSFVRSYVNACNVYCIFILCLLECYGREQYVQAQSRAFKVSYFLPDMLLAVEIFIISFVWLRGFFSNIFFCLFSFLLFLVFSFWKNWQCDCKISFFLILLIPTWFSSFNCSSELASRSQKW